MVKKKTIIRKTSEDLEEIPREIKKKQERQIRNFLLLMLFLFIFVLVVYMIYQASIKFSYAGLEFEKTREKDLILYRTPNLPVFFRNDPRELRDIKIEGKIVLQRNLGIGGDVEGCSDSVLSATTLNVFYNRAGLKTYPVTRNESQAQNFNITYVECNQNLDYSAILFEKGSENKIKKQANCYILEFSNCEILKVAERFMIASYAHSKNIEV